MKNIEDLTKRIIPFRDARDWKQFHNPKDVAMSLCLDHFSHGEISKFLKISARKLWKFLAKLTSE